MNYGLPYQGSKNRIARRLPERQNTTPQWFTSQCRSCHQVPFIYSGDLYEVA